MKINTNPKLYILPGWGHRLSDPGYKKIIALFNKYELKPLRISTRNRKYSLGSPKSFKEIINSIQKQIAQPSDHDIIFGFSIGALEVHELARRIPFRKVFICSISPTLGEDMRSYKREEVRDFSPLQHHEMSKIEYGKLINKNVYIFYGSKESDILKLRSRQIAKENHIKAIEIKAADHELDGAYLRRLRSYLN